MGVLPLQFIPGETRKTLALTGDEQFDIFLQDGQFTPKQKLEAVIHYPDKKQRKISLLLRLDTAVEVQYYRAGGVLNYVLDRIADQS